MAKKREEDLSPEELHARIEEDKKKLARSGVLAFSALVAIIVLCIAWFVSNNKVSMTSGTISADANVPFELASVGERQHPERDYLQLNAGTSETNYGAYYDIEKNQKIAKEQSYYVGSNNLAWYLGGQETISPGASGQMDLYLIPKTSGLKSATIKLEIEAYTKSGTTAQKSEDATLQNLVKGHVLFFGSLDKDRGYSDWHNVDTEFEVKAPDGEFEKNQPYKVSLYWVWPKYFHNYIYTDRSTQGDLFDKVTDDYTGLNKFVNAQKEAGSSKLFYNLGNSLSISGNIGMEMSESTLNLCSDYYNQADEYIGKNANFLYIHVTVQ